MKSLKIAIVPLSILGILALVLTTFGFYPTDATNSTSKESPIFVNITNESSTSSVLTTIIPHTSSNMTIGSDGFKESSLNATGNGSNNNLGNATGNGSNNNLGNATGNGSNNNLGNATGNGSNNNLGNATGNGSNNNLGNATGNGSNNNLGNATGNGSNNNLGNATGNGSNNNLGNATGNGSNNNLGNATGNGSNNNLGNATGNGSNNNLGNATGNGSQDGHDDDTTVTKDATIMTEILIKNNCQPESICSNVDAYDIFNVKVFLFVEPPEEFDVSKVPGDNLFYIAFPVDNDENVAYNVKQVRKNFALLPWNVSVLITRKIVRIV